MAIEIRSDRADLKEWLAPLNHNETALAVTAERTVSRNFGGSCQIPLAAFATIDGVDMRLRAIIATPDGSKIASADLTGAADAPEVLGRQIADALQQQDAAAILALCKTDADGDV
ncbi:Porphobilinogen deaminase [compost metagenome]